MIGSSIPGRGCLFTTASKPDLRSTQPPIQWVPGALSLGIKLPRREADHSPAAGTEVKECVELYLHSPNTTSRRGAQLKHRDNFTLLYLTLLDFTLRYFTFTVIVHCPRYLGSFAYYVMELNFNYIIAIIL